MDFMEKKQHMQTILGAGGVIGNGLANELTRYSDQIRLVSRNPQPISGNEEIVKADLTDPAETFQAVEGSEVVYLTVGLPYNTKVWKQLWPKVMQNTIDACKKYECRLVFFDNVYMYGKVDGWMTEETPFDPDSKKGEVRATIASMLLNEVKAGNLKALIARSADFYGPKAANSIVNAMVFDRFRQKLKPQWMGSDKVRHSFTYTPDAIKAVALLGNNGDAYNQTWHLPTHRDALTGQAFIEKVAQEFNAPAKYTLLKKWMLSMVGWFVPIIGETVEMYYQQQYEYLFDSSKFENAFNFQPTTYDEGIKETVKK